MIHLGQVFLKSVSDGDLEKVKACITLGVDINYMYQGKNALIYAIMPDGLNRRQILDLLIHQPNINVNFEVNSQEDSKVIPFLHYIAKMSKFNSRFGIYGIDYIYKKVFEAPGVNFNAQGGFFRQTLVHYCLAHIKPTRNKIEVVKLFTQCPGLDWNIPDDDGEMLIHCATQLAIKGHECDIDILKRLLSVPSLDVNSKDSRNENIANYAANSIYYDICCQEQADVDGSMCNECFIARGWEEVIKLLSQDQRINWNNKNSFGNTPLMQAVEDENVEVVKALLSIPSVDVNVLEDMPMTPVMLKCIQHLRDVTTISLSIPECPVCYDQFQRGHPIYQCDSGHFVCGSCYERVNSCPVCRGDMMGRCTDFEKFLENNVNNI